MSSGRSITLSRDDIEAGRSTRGGFSKAQLRALGVMAQHERNYPSRWLRNSVGTTVPLQDYQAFLKLKDEHIGKAPNGQAFAAMSKREMVKRILELEQRVATLEGEGCR